MNHGVRGADNGRWHHTLLIYRDPKNNRTTCRSLTNPSMTDPSSLAWVPTVEQLVERLAHRHQLDDGERDMFRAWVLERCAEDDHRIVRAIEGRSSAKSYLAVVVVNLFREYHTRRSP
jgi:hypothetical protein